MSRAGRAAAWAGGVAATAAAGVVLSRAAVRRSRGRPDPEAGERLTELPPEDLGPVVSYDGTLLSVRAAGQEGLPVILLVHGFSLDMTTWYFQWREFSARFRCVVYDQRGHGSSGQPENGDYSLQAMGRDLKVVLDAVAPEGPAILVGHSMGGMAILALAEAHPEVFGAQVSGAVFADTAAAELVRGALAGVIGRLHALATTPGRADRVRRYLRSGESDLAYLLARATNFGPRAPASLVDHVAAISGRAPVEVWTDALAGVLSLDLRHAVEHVRVPALVVVGDLDRVTPPASAKKLQEALPDARLAVLKGAGHMAIMERHEQFNRLLAKFLEEALSSKKAPAAGRPSRAGAASDR